MLIQFSYAALYSLIPNAKTARMSNLPTVFLVIDTHSSESPIVVDIYESKQNAIDAASIYKGRSQPVYVVPYEPQGEPIPVI